MSHKYDTVVTVIIDNDENDEITDDEKTNDNSLTGVIYEIHLNYIGVRMFWFGCSVVIMFVFRDLVIAFIFSLPLLNCYE